jgi:hypothetical protein
MIAIELSVNSLTSNKEYYSVSRARLYHLITCRLGRKVNLIIVIITAASNGPILANWNLDAL